MDAEWSRSKPNGVLPFPARIRNAREKNRVDVGVLDHEGAPGQIRVHVELESAPEAAAEVRAETANRESVDDLLVLIARREPPVDVREHADLQSKFAVARLNRNTVLSGDHPWWGRGWGRLSWWRCGRLLRSSRGSPCKREGDGREREPAEDPAESHAAGCWGCRRCRNHSMKIGRTETPMMPSVTSVKFSFTMGMLPKSSPPPKHTPTQMAAPAKL